MVWVMIQWSFLVPLTGGRWYISPQLAVYTTYILPIGWLYITYHLLREPGNSCWMIVGSHLVPSIHPLPRTTRKLQHWAFWSLHAWHAGWGAVLRSRSGPKWWCCKGSVLENAWKIQVRFRNFVVICLEIIRFYVIRVNSAGESFFFGGKRK